MKGRPSLLLIPAALGALLLNLVLFAAAALLARDRTVEPREYEASTVQLVSLQPPEIDRPEPVRQPPQRVHAVRCGPAPSKNGSPSASPARPNRIPCGTGPNVSPAPMAFAVARSQSSIFP